VLIEPYANEALNEGIPVRIAPDDSVYKKLGLIADPTSVVAAVDMSFANAAYKQLGAYKPK